MRDELQQQNIDPLKVISELRQPAKRINCEFFETASDVPDPALLNKSDKNLMIFDDL